MRKPRKQFGPALVPQAEPAIEWRDYDRIEPGVYLAYCRWARHYRDRGLKRWTCLARFDVLSDDLVQVLARVPWWLSLGEGEKPHAARRGKYLKEWVRANGEPPKRGDRLSPRIFTRRIARVELDYTDPNKSPVPYSVVRKILSWETGTRVRGSLSHQVTQSRKAGDNPEQSKQLSEANGKTISARAGVRVVSLHHTPKGRASRFVGSPVKGKDWGVTRWIDDEQQAKIRAQIGHNDAISPKLPASRAVN